MKTLDLSVIVITKNEEHNLPRCLASLPYGARKRQGEGSEARKRQGEGSEARKRQREESEAEVIVVDSGSSDRTVEIARDYGAEVVVSPFVDYADQKNKALALATRTWVFSIDADEEMDTDLRNFLLELPQHNIPEDVGGFWIRRQLFFMGRKVGASFSSNSKSVRLFRREGATFQNKIHERVIFNIDCRVLKLKKGVLHHYSYADLHDFYTKLNRYSSIDARYRYEAGKKVPRLFFLRPFFDFFKFYFLRRLFLSGYPGFCCALLTSIYGFVKYAKLAEMYRQGRSHHS